MWFRPELRLQNLAVIAFAASYVKSFSIRSIRSILDEIGYRETDYALLHGNGKFTDLLQDKIKALGNLHLPKTILNRIVHAIDPLLVRCISWHAEIKYHLGLVYFDLGIFHWTCYGAVDAAKTIEKWALWFDASLGAKENAVDRFVLLRYKKFSALDVKFLMYYMACSCAWKSFIESHYLDIIQFYDEYCNAMSYIENKTVVVLPQGVKIDYILYSIYYLNDDISIKKQILKEYENRVKSNYNFKHIIDNINSWKNIPDIMFSKSVEQECNVGARYYWGLLSPEKKDEHVISAALSSSKILQTVSSLDLLTFLILHMSQEQIEQYILANILNCYDYILVLRTRSFIDYWPWEEIFFPIFDVLKPHAPLKFLFSLLLEILKKMTYMKRVLGYEFNPVHYRMFLTVLEEVKRLQTENVDSYLIPDFSDGQEFFELYDLEIIKLVREFLCKDDESKKKFVEPTYGNLFGKFVRENRFEEIDDFINVVFVSDDDKTWFRKSFEPLNVVLFNNADFQVLDNLLDLQSDSEEERRNYKCNVIVQGDLISVCGRLFIMKEIEEAEKFRNWALADEKVKEKYIVNYTTDKGFWLLLMWETCLEESDTYELGIERAKTKTTEFLTWVFEKDEIVTKCKEMVLANENSIKNFLTYFKSPYVDVSRYQILDELLQFLVSAEAVAFNKRKIWNNIQEWLEFLSRTGNLILESNNFLNYVTNGASKKEEAVKIFLQSESRYQFFKKLYLCTDDSVSRAEWLRSWVEMGLDKNKLDSYLNDICSNLLNRDQARLWFNELLGIGTLENR